LELKKQKQKQKQPISRISLMIDESASSSQGKQWLTTARTIIVQRKLN